MEGMGKTYSLPPLDTSHRAIDQTVPEQLNKICMFPPDLVFFHFKTNTIHKDQRLASARPRVMARQDDVLHVHTLPSFGDRPRSQTPRTSGCGDVE